MGTITAESTLTKRQRAKFAHAANSGARHDASPVA